MLKIAIHDVGGNQAAAVGTEAVHLYQQIIRNALLHAGEITVHVSIPEMRIHKRQIREVRIEHLARRNRGKHAGDRGKEIGLRRSQRQRRQNEIVVAKVLPQIIEWPIVKDAVTAAQQRAPVAEQIVRRIGTNGPVLFVRCKELLIAAVSSFCPVYKKGV